MSLSSFACVILATPSTVVIPAKAGTHFAARAGGGLGPSFRWDDIEEVA
jgi:hypothetical protein